MIHIVINYNVLKFDYTHIKLPIQVDVQLYPLTETFFPRKDQDIKLEELNKMVKSQEVKETWKFEEAPESFKSHKTFT